MKKMYVDVVHIYIFIFFKLDKWLQSYHLRCINMYNLDRGGVHWQIFLSFPTFSNHFTLMWLKMTHNGKFGQKSGLDWVQTANFACFSIFSPKMRLRLTRNGQFHLIHNFSHLLPPKHLIFGEISKIFILGGWRYIGKFFWLFQLFQIISHQCG